MKTVRLADLSVPLPAALPEDYAVSKPAMVDGCMAQVCLRWHGYAEIYNGAQYPA